jgi:hypothetical protein
MGVCCDIARSYGRAVAKTLGPFLLTRSLWWSLFPEGHFKTLSQRGSKYISWYYKINYGRTMVQAVSRRSLAEKTQV